MRRKGLLLALLAIATVSGFIGRYFVRSAVPPLATTPTSSVEEAADSAEEAASPVEETANPVEESTSPTEETISPAEDPSPAEIDSSLDQENADGTSATSGETPSVDLSAIEPSFVEPSASQPERLRLHIADAPAENSELTELDIVTINQDDIADTNSGTPEVPLTGGVGSAELVARWQDLTRATTLLLLGAIILLAAARWLFSGTRK